VLKRTSARKHGSLEGSACLREAASAKAGPTKLVEGPRLRAVTHFGVQARALARGAPHLTAETFSKHRNISCNGSTQD